ncbi:hypothetical protein P9112_008046 [Eukaryota sp. TZLM1-RC]
MVISFGNGDTIDTNLFNSVLNLLSFVNFTSIECWLSLNSEQRGKFLKIVTRGIYIEDFQRNCLNCLVFLSQFQSIATSLVNFESFFVELTAELINGNQVFLDNPLLWTIFSNCLVVSKARNLIVKNSVIKILVNFVMVELDCHKKRINKKSIIPTSVESKILTCLALIAQDQNLIFQLFKFSGFIPCLISIISDCMSSSDDVASVSPIFLILRCIVVNPDSTSLFSSVNYRELLSFYLNSNSHKVQVMTVDFFKAMFSNRKLVKESQLDDVYDYVIGKLSEFELCNEASNILNSIKT